MISQRLVALVLIAVAAGVVLPLRAAEPPREMHGMSDVFAAPGIALAWGILRGANEAATIVVLRVLADPAVFPAVAAIGTDPFTQRTISVLAATPNSGKIDVQVPRAQFADYPRTDLKFYESSAAARSDAPKAVVYFLGVPDTTPEFASDAALDAYLVDRLARTRAGPQYKTP